MLAELDGQIEAARAAEDACWSGAEFNDMRCGSTARIVLCAMTLELSHTATIIRYRLLSVLVHEGSHLSGHYFRSLLAREFFFERLIF